MALAVVQSVGGSYTLGGTSCTAVFASNPTSGNLIVVGFDAPAATTSLSGCGVTTWTKANSGKPSGGDEVEIWYGFSAGGTNKTVTATCGTSGNLVCCAIEVSGAPTTGLVGSTTALGTGTTSPATSPGMSVVSGQMAVGFAWAGSALNAANSPFTNVLSQLSSGSYYAGLAYDIASTTTTLTPTWTLPGSGTWAAVGTVFNFTNVVSASGSGSFSLTGSGAANETVTVATIAGPLSFAGSGTAALGNISTAGVSALTLSGSGTASIVFPFQGSGSTAFAGSGFGTSNFNLISGSGAGNIVFSSGTGTANIKLATSGTSALSFGSITAFQIYWKGSTTLTLVSQATHNSSILVQGSSSFALSSIIATSIRAQATGTVSVSVTGHASPQLWGDLSISLSASGQDSVPSLGSTSLHLQGSGAGSTNNAGEASTALNAEAQVYDQRTGTAALSVSLSTAPVTVKVYASAQLVLTTASADSPVFPLTGTAKATIYTYSTPAAKVTALSGMTFAATAVISHIYTEPTASAQTTFEAAAIVSVTKTGTASFGVQGSAQTHFSTTALAVVSLQITNSAQTSPIKCFSYLTLKANNSGITPSYQPTGECTLALTSNLEGWARSVIGSTRVLTSQSGRFL